MASPKVSIVVTSYNIEAYISQCLETICGQTLKDIEIIVVDDGSTDGTKSVISEFAKKDDRIVFVPLPENTIGGVASAANAGLERCTGDYVGFADGDDLYETSMFEKLYSISVKHDADLAMCKYLLLDEATGEKSAPAEEKRWYDISDTECFELNAMNQKRFLQFIAVPWRKLYRRELIDANQLRFPVGDFFYEDNPFHWFSIVSARSIVVEPEVLCYHRVARVGQSMEVADERLFKMFEHHETIRSWLINNDLEPLFRIALLGWVTSQVEWISQRTPPHLVDVLFESLSNIYEKYSQADIDEMIDEFSKGKRARKLTEALVNGSKSEFNVVLFPSKESIPTKRSLFQEGLFRLRTEGLVRTSRLTAEYLARKVGVKARKSPSVRSNDPVRNTDVLFALTVIQKRLDDIEEKINRLEKR